MSDRLAIMPDAIVVAHQACTVIEKSWLNAIDQFTHVAGICWSQQVHHGRVLFGRGAGIVVEYHLGAGQFIFHGQLPGNTGNSPMI